VVNEIQEDRANLTDPSRLRFSVSRVTQGKQVFYTLTMPSEVLARTCKVSTRKEDPKEGFQRELDVKRAQEIARYIDDGVGTIPNSIVLSAQAEADLRIVGRGKTLEFNDTPGAFLILDGQHRVYGFSKAKTSLRVPVVLYNGLSRKEESRLFIDINTKQRPVPTQLLLDIKQVAEIEDDGEVALRQIFDMFHEDGSSALRGITAPFETEKGKITRVTFNHAVKPLLEYFPGRTEEIIYDTLNNYLLGIQYVIEGQFDSSVIGRAVVFRALMGLFPAVAQRAVDRFDGDYSSRNFATIIEPIFSNITKKRIESPGTSWTSLRDYLTDRLKKKLVL
jgi:DGQHR domain-containing protein